MTSQRCGHCGHVHRAPPRTIIICQCGQSFRVKAKPTIAKGTKQPGGT